MSRLSAASGSGVGMAIGAAVAGPIGFFAGGYIGSKLGGQVFEEGGEKPAASTDAKVEDAAPDPILQRAQGTSERTFAPTAPIGSDEDLLGLNTLASSQRQSSNYPLTTSDPAKTIYRPPLAKPTKSHPPAGDEAHRQSSNYPLTTSVPAKTICRPPVANPSESFPPAGGEADLLGLGISYDTPAANTVPHLRQPPAPIMSHPLQAGVSQPTQSADSHLPTSHVPDLHAPLISSVSPSTDESLSHQHYQTAGHASVPHATPSQASYQREQHEGYRFGDLTKSVVARGKWRDGRSEAEGYKFGDFTRGLFG